MNQQLQWFTVIVNLNQNRFASNDFGIESANLLSRFVWGLYCVSTLIATSVVILPRIFQLCDFTSTI
jgi:hypothetical protein